MPQAALYAWDPVAEAWVKVQVDDQGQILVSTE